MGTPSTIPPASPSRESGLYWTKAVDPIDIAVDHMSDEVRAVYESVIATAATAKAAQDSLDAVQLAYHWLARQGGTPAQRRRQLKLVQSDSYPLPSGEARKPS